MTEPTTPLTDTALQRLRALCKGNGIDPDSLQLVETKEQTYALPGQITLTPQFSVESRTVIGRIKSKGRQVLSSFSELETQIQTLEKEFKEKDSWIDHALDELKKVEGTGWGLSDAMLVWGDAKTTLAATENCPVCRGSAMHPCPTCRGIGHMTCEACLTTGRELCYFCHGTGRDPTNPNNPCPTCEGQQYALCRKCQGTRKVLCPACRGRGNIPCADCKGTGCVSREVTLKQAADMAFSLVSTSELPSGLLRMISRIGNQRLIKGHADVKMIPLSDEDRAAKGKVTVRIEAAIPYADIKIKFGDKGALVSCCGKQGRLAGVPPFLDRALAPALKTLQGAMRDADALAKASSLRAVNEALNLILAGKTNPNDLRRIYPVGLSADAATDLMKTIQRVIRRSTERARQIAAGLSVLGTGGLFAGVFLTPFYASVSADLSPLAQGGIKAALLLSTLGIVWAVLTQAGHHSLSKRFPNSPIARRQTIGKTGYGTLAAVGILYMIILFVSGLL